MMLTPGATQFLNRGKQPFGLALGERTRRLVHDDDARVLRQRLGDFDHLLLGERQRAHESGRWRNVEAEALQVHLALGVHLAALVQQPQRAGPERLAPEEDVRGDIEIVQNVEFLVDEPDAQRQRVGDVPDRHRLARRSESRPRRAGARRPWTFISVDLPAPFSPMSATTSPRPDGQAHAPRARPRPGTAW